MGADRKNSQREGKEERERRRRKVEEIVSEAGERAASAQAGGPGHPKDAAADEELRRHLEESERKRRLLAEALHASREQLRGIGGYPPEEDRALPFGVYVRPGRETAEGRTVIIRHHGRLYEARVAVAEEFGVPARKGGTLHDHRLRSESRELREGEFLPGELLLLNNDLHVVEARGFELVCGSLATVEQVLDSEKVLVRTAGDETILVARADPMRRVNLVAGDNVEYDPDCLFVYSLLPKTRVDRLALERVPDIGYEDIGGLEQAVAQIRDAIELPRLYPEYFEEHRLVSPKGILLYGPPGCGKTLIAKAVANSLARSIREKTGEAGESFFLNVKGPELLNKFVGETEQAIRDLFARARHQATHRTPVVIFFDEMDAMFRVRGSGVSSDMESTIVPQFLAELDGLQSLENVVVIGATNREDLIDPAILRPGRLDRKIRIPRPDRRAAADIFSKYLLPDLPIDAGLSAEAGGPAEAVGRMIGRAVEEMYSMKPANELLEVTFADGSRKMLYYKDLSSGAIIENIVRRAKFMAVKELIRSGRKGIGMDHLSRAIHEEFKENEDLPSSSNPAEWYRIIGKGGERVIRIRYLQRGDGGDDPAVPRETVRVPEDLE